MSEVSKAIVLAAGRGTRMGALTADIPKPMLHVAGKPLLEHILDGLREAGITRVLLVVGYRREMIIGHFRRYPLDIEFRVQEKLEGTARAVALGREFGGEDPCLISFGDIVCSPQDYRGMIGMLQPDASGILGAKWVDDPWQGAAIYEDGGVVRRIVEKPSPGASQTHWNSAGLYVFRGEFFDFVDRTPMSPRGEYELTSAVEDMLRAGRRLLLYSVAGAWRDVGRPDDILAVERWLNSQ